MNDLYIEPDIGLMPQTGRTYDEADHVTSMKRTEIARQVIERFFAGRVTYWNAEQAVSLEYETIMRSVNAGPDFEQHIEEAKDLAFGGFMPELKSPSRDVEAAFYSYGQTNLGAFALKALLKMDQQYIDKGWRLPTGALTYKGVEAYGKGLWRPFRVASNGYESDTVTPSGALMVPDDFRQEEYSTGDIANPLAILHHELKAHVLPLKEAEGLEPGKEMELICIRFESEMLRELGLRERMLNWGKDDGTLDHTLHEESEQYYYGLVRFDREGKLVEVNPETGEVTGAARVKG